MFFITDEAIHHEDYQNQCDDERSGAFTSFDGRVRNHNEGMKVSSLEYQCYHSMAEKEGNRIIQEALEKFEVFKVFCVHREGHLKIGETAVWVGVSSSHRKEAFEACQYIIDQVKLRVPIWKKEYYKIGENIEEEVKPQWKKNSEYEKLRVNKIDY